MQVLAETSGEIEPRNDRFDQSDADAYHCGRREGFGESMAQRWMEHRHNADDFRRPGAEVGM